jgi:hypothetical protein
MTTVPCVYWRDLAVRSSDLITPEEDPREIRDAQLADLEQRDLDTEEVEARDDPREIEGAQ